MNYYLEYIYDYFLTTISQLNTKYLRYINILISYIYIIQYLREW